MAGVFKILDSVDEERPAFQNQCVQGFAEGPDYQGQEGAPAVA
jgi:hypothetical protein